MADVYKVHSTWPIFDLDIQFTLLKGLFKHQPACDIENTDYQLKFAFVANYYLFAGRIGRNSYLCRQFIFFDTRPAKRKPGIIQLPKSFDFGFPKKININTIVWSIFSVMI